MDWGRHAYKTRFRPWENSNEESTLEWVEALPDAPTITTWSVIGMSEWERKPPVGGVGEVPGARRTGTRRVAPEGLDGSHVCATPHEIEFGGLYLPDDPPAEYDELGYLTCCEVPTPPPPVVPIALGANCSQAGAGLVAVDYEATVPVPSSDVWWSRIPVPVGVPCRFTWTTESAGAFEVRVYGGANCDGLFWVIELADPNECHTFTSPFSPQVWPTFRRISGGSGPFTVQFRIDVGACP